MGAWIAAGVIGGSLGYPDDGPLSWLLTGLLGLGAVPLGGGLMALANSLRMQRTLSSNPWVAYAATYREVGTGGTPNGNPTLYLGPGREHALTLVAFKWRWQLFAGVSQVLFAGDLGRGGVASPEGELHLVWCRRPASRRWRRKIQWSSNGR